MPAPGKPFSPAHVPLLPDPQLGPPVVDLAAPLSPSPHECSRAAVRAWEGHVAAGRIGAPASSPSGPGELRLASLARILGHRE